MTESITSTGTVEWFDDKLGAGYIREDTGRLIYVHYKDIASTGHRTLSPKDQVRFELIKTDEGTRAKRVRPSKEFDPADYARSRLAKSLIKWFHSRKSTRYMWVVRNSEVAVNMVRYYLIQCRFLEIYIHQFIQSDDDILHDHPWGFLTFVLSGRYDEELLDGTTRTLSAPRMLYRPAQHIHRVLLEDQMKGRTWTLVFTGRRINSWHFWGRRSKEPMTPKEYASYRGQSLSTNDDFKISGIILPRLNNGTATPNIVELDEVRSERE